jgi:hypothetical protein
MPSGLPSPPRRCLLPEDGILYKLKTLGVYSWGEITSNSTKNCGLPWLKIQRTQSAWLNTSRAVGYIWIITLLPSVEKDVKPFRYEYYPDNTDLHLLHTATRPSYRRIFAQNKFNEPGDWLTCLTLRRNTGSWLRAIWGATLCCPCCRTELRDVRKMTTFPRLDSNCN